MKRVGPYELVEELGRGGMGAVFRARRVDAPGTEVAVKMLLSPLGDMEERARFEREVQALRRLDHPGVTRLLDAGVTEERLPYLVLQLMTGGSLHERLRTEGRLEAREAAELTRKLAEAVDYAHGRGVLHRDLKPHNVLFDAAGEPQLSDFGLARITQWDERLTATGEILGTPAFMAPEQALGERSQIGAASDVYGLGATLYAMLAGRPPFRAGSTLALLDRVMKQTPDPLPAGIDPQLEEICRKCLEKDLARRYANGAELAAALGEWLEGGPRRSGRAGRVVVGVLGLGVLAAVVAAVAIRATDPAPEPTSASGTPIPEPTGSAAVGSAAAAVPQASPDEALAAYERAKAKRAWPEALRHARQAVAIRKTSRTWRALALALWNEGSATARHQAVAASREAIALDPKAALPRIELVTMLKNLKDNPGMVRELYLAWRVDPGGFTPSHRDVLTTSLFAAGRFRDALPVLDASIADQPDRHELRVMRATGRWWLWKREAALAEVEEVLRSRPPPKVAQAAAHHTKRYRAALKESERRRVRSGERKLEALATKARRAFHAGHFRRARRLYDQLLALRRAPVYLIEQGEVLAMRNDGVGALKLFSEALKHAAHPRIGARAAWKLALRGFSGDAAAGERHLNRAIDLDPTLGEALAHRSLVRFHRGFYAEAAADVAQAVALEPNLPTVILGGAWRDHQAGRHEAALDGYTRALRDLTGAQRSIAEEGRGLVLLRLGRREEAERTLKPHRKPGRFRALFAFAELRWKDGRREEALADQRLGLEGMDPTHPDYPTHQREYERMHAELGTLPTPIRRLRDLLKEFEEATERRAFDEALARATEAVRKQRSVRTLQALTAALWGLGRKGEALAVSRDAVALAPNRAPLRIALASMLEAMNDDRGALRERWAAWRIDPRRFNATSRKTLMQELFRIGRMKDGLSVVDDSLRRGGDGAALRQARSSMLWALYDRKAAIEEVKRGVTLARDAKAREALRGIQRQMERMVREINAVAVRPQDTELKASARAAAQVAKRGDWAGAAKAIQGVLQRRRSPPFLQFLALCYQKLERHDKAIEALKEAFSAALEPSEAAAAAWQLAQAFLPKHDAMRTTIYLNRSIDLVPTARALSYRGLLRLNFGYWSEGFADCRRALELNRKDGRAWVGVGWEAFHGKRYAEALGHFERALKLFPRSQALRANDGKAAALVRLGRGAEAAPILNEGLRLLPKQYRLRLTRAELRWSTGDRAGALADQRAGLKLLSATHPLRPMHERRLERWESGTGR